MNRIAQELIEISKLLIALDCKKFEQDYAKLMRQYHTMHGPGKRDMRKTLDVMEDRLRTDCGESEKKGEFFVKNRKKSPDDLWRTKGEHKILTFIYFPKVGKIFTHKTRSHQAMMGNLLPKLNSKYFSRGQIEDIYDSMGIDMDEELFDKFPYVEAIGENWHEFVEFVTSGRGMYSRTIKEILVGNWGDYDDSVILGRASQEFDDETWAVSFWGKPSKSLMKRIAAKLKVDVKTIYLWN